MQAHSTGICDTKGNLDLGAEDPFPLTIAPKSQDLWGFPRLFTGSLIHTYDWRTHKENIVLVFVYIHMCWGWGSCGGHRSPLDVFFNHFLWFVVVVDFETRSLTEAGE